LEKIIKKSHGKTLQQFTVFQRKKNYKAKFLISSILKIKSTETILEKKKQNKQQKKEKKIMLETL
jgi:hypothetical protein